MNIITHNERPSLVGTVSEDDNVCTTVCISGSRLQEMLGSCYWIDGIPMWFVEFKSAQLLIIPDDPYTVDDLDEVEGWLIRGDFPATAGALSHLIENGEISIKRTSKVGKATKLPLPDRRTA